MTDANSANAYLRTKILTASQEELRLMLLDGALRFARQAVEGLNGKRYEDAYNGFTKCRDIIMELIGGIGPDIDPEIGEKVRALYTFMYTELLEASFDKDAERVGKVIELLEYERETWVLAMRKIATERSEGRIPGRNAGADTPRATPAPQPAAGGAERQSFSFQA